MSLPLAGIVLPVGKAYNQLVLCRVREKPEGAERHASTGVPQVVYMTGI